MAGAKGRSFSTNFSFELGGFPVEFTLGYTAVDATVDGQTFLFVNTHLEVENIPCSTPTGVMFCQDAQAIELLEAIEPSEYRAVLVGDFNAVPGTIAYETVVADGYVDTWNSDTEDGATCCQEELR